MFVSREPGEATILHADLDSFYASVEQRDRPELRGRPVIVGEGVVLAASYEAKATGVVTAMNGRQARRLCPDAVVVGPRMEAYSRASRDVFAVFDDTTPAVEALSIDEAFLEVGGLRRIRGEPVDIARRLRAEVARRVGLPITVGVARTKFLAKVASGVAKPDGLLVVEPDRELEFLHPLPVERLWGVGAKTAAKLDRIGITTVREVAELPVDVLTGLVGVAAGCKLHALSHNRDPRVVTTGRRRSSMGSQRALGRGPKSHDDVTAVVHGIVDRVTRRMRGSGRAGRTVVLRFRFDDFSRATRSRTLTEPTADTAPVLRAALELLDAMWPTIERAGLTLIGLSMTNLDDSGAVQQSLPFDDRSGLDRALDAVVAKYGGGAVGRVAGLGRDDGFSVPMLPD